MYISVGLAYAPPILFCFTLRVLYFNVILYNVIEHYVLTIYEQYSVFCISNNQLDSENMTHDLPSPEKARMPS